MSNEINNLKSNKNIFLIPQNIQDKENHENSGLDHAFLCKKRKSSLDPENNIIEEGNKESLFCKNCKTQIIQRNPNFDENNINNDLCRIIFENKKEIEDIFSSLLNSVLSDDKGKKNKNIFCKNIQKYCNLCIQKMFVKGGISNLNPLSKNNLNEKNNEENYLEVIISKYNSIEETINEINNMLNNLSKKDNLTESDEALIHQIKDNFAEYLEKLSEINILLENIIQSNELSENDSDKFKKGKDIYEISDKSRICCLGETKENSKTIKQYSILSKDVIYESKYEKIHKSKISKIFQYNSLNQLKNYLHNFPILFNKSSNSSDNIGNNSLKNNTLINSLSDIKNLENNCNLKKSKINPIIIPFKNNSSEVEKKITKPMKNKAYNNLSIDYNASKKNILNNTNENHNINNEFKNRQNLNSGLNNITLENNISNKNILLKYLISSYQINQKLLNQINLGMNPLNNIINGINNNNIINEMLNQKTIEFNANINNIPNQINDPLLDQFNHSLFNNDNYGNINNLNQFMNNPNDNIKLYNNLNSFYNPNFMNNLNRMNFGDSFNYLNEIVERKNILKNNSFDNLNKFINKNQIPNQEEIKNLDNNSNYILKDKIFPSISPLDSFSINNNNKYIDLIKNKNNNDINSEIKFDENNKTSTKKNNQ